MRRGLQTEREEHEGSLLSFVRRFWHVVEPARPFVNGWVADAICIHLEAVTYGHIQKLLINVPPGPMRDDSIVWTAQGEKELSEIRVGDMVLTHRGRFRRVDAVHHQGLLPILRITTESGRVTHAAPNHPYWTTKGWVEARKLRVGSILGVPMVGHDMQHDRVASISKDKRANCMCLTVDEDHSFTCSGIAVSNSTKSLLCSVFWPAWEYAIGLAHHRFLMFSYAGHLTARDNRRFLDIVSSDLYQQMFGDRVHLVKTGESLITTEEKGWKLATSLDGVGTGERGDRVICDDGNNIRQQDSKEVRDKTNEWVGSAMMNRLNDMDKSAIVIIQQRMHENDISGFVLSKGLDFHHLMIQAEYDPAYHCSTAIGWTDPRSEYGEIFWPERFSPAVLAEQKRAMGPFNWSGQYQQTPKTREGGIFARDYWQDWLEPVYPPFRFVLGSVDPAMTEKEINDPSGFTKWGVFEDHGRPRVMLIGAWQKRLAIMGPTLVQETGEDDLEFKARQKAKWGLIEWLQESCKKSPAADILLVENKASGYSVGQAIVALNSQAPFGIVMIDPKGRDKVSRAMAVQHMFAEGMVYAPMDKKFAEMVVEQMELFPKGKLDDLVDSATQSMRWLRDNGFVERQEDILAESMSSMQHRGPERPLYPV